MSISILIAEDDPLLQSFLGEALGIEEDLAVVGMVANGRDCLEAVERLRPDVLLLDLHLPGFSGQKVLQALMAQEQAPRVLVLTGDEGEDTQLEVAQSGAQGFLPKSQARSVLLAGIRSVAGGGLWFSREISNRLIAEHQRLVRQVREQQRPLHQLTEREQEVLVRVARGMTNSQIAADLYMSIHTVKLHIQNILRKLNLPNRTEAAVFAVREGLLDRLDDDAPGA